MNKRITTAFLGLCLLILLASCGQNMRDQARCQPLEASAFFADGKCAQQLPANTVARGQVSTQTRGMPSPITREFLVLGRTRYEAFCAPCHGITGYGNGMIVQRGFPAPPSFHTQRLRDVPPEYIVDVITNGFGRMFSYAYRVPEDERWAIAAYIRALQLSQNATLDDVPPEERQQLQGAAQ
jgi:cytochrome c553